MAKFSSPRVPLKYHGGFRRGLANPVTIFFLKEKIAVPFFKTLGVFTMVLPKFDLLFAAFVICP